MFNGDISLQLEVLQESNAIDGSVPIPLSPLPPHIPARSYVFSA